MNPNKWSPWEIIPAVATGGWSALQHAMIQGGYNLSKNIIEPVGNNIGSAIGAFNNNITNQGQAYNSAEAEKDRQWQEQMSNTSIQRQVADLKAAGLNPWLALNGGSAVGASTPSGASASYNSAFANTYALTNTNQTLVNAITKLSSSAMSLIGSLAKLI